MLCFFRRVLLPKLIEAHRKRMLQELSKRFAVPGLTFEQGSGGLLRAVVNTPASQGELVLQGAHVTNWKPAGHQPVLWLSQKSHFEKGKPIRGGVPICFPWFGPNAEDGTLPAHGFARLIEWEMIGAHANTDGSIELRLETSIDLFALRFQVEFGRELKITLTTQLSADAKSRQSYEDALHTYFAVSDVRTISIEGLEGTAYVDKVDQAILKASSGRPIRFTGETDRVYAGTQADCILIDEGMRRVIRVAKLGSSSTVVWNPWVDKSKRMVDFGDEEWSKMVCIETANVGGSRIELSPGESHSTTTTISVRTLNINRN